MADFLPFLYHTVPGRILLRPLTSRILSQICGRFLDSGFSRFLIKPFAENNHIDLAEYQLDHIHSFNDFFARPIKEGMRPINPDPDILIAPCDGLLSVYPISKDLVIPVKQSRYRISDLLKSKKGAALFDGGFCLVYRLCVDHYHRYCYVESGHKGRNRFIPGKLHTVRPIALRSLPIFTENCREYTVIRTQKGGTILQMEVGAMLVGKICNHHPEKTVRRGEEKGYFAYGGSTIIVLVQKNRVDIPEALLQNTRSGYETPVKMGQSIAPFTPDFTPGSATDSDPLQC